MRTLLLVDSELRARRLSAVLERSGFAVEARRTSSLEELVEVLPADAWELVIAFHAPPEYDALLVLQRLHRYADPPPVLVVGDGVEETEAAALLAAGAGDVLSTSAYPRLGAVVRRELVGWALHRDHRQVRRALAESEGQLRTMERLQQALIRAKDEWERTFDTVPELVFLTDERCEVVRLNRAVSARLGREPRDLIGRGCRDILYGGAEHDACDLCRRLTPHADKAEFDCVCEGLGGEFRFSITRRYDDGGNLLGMIHVGRDVTAQRRVEELLKRQAVVDQAEHIFRTFRHELGNALNTLKTALQVLHRNYDRFSVERRELYLNRCLDTFRIAEQLLVALRGYQSLDNVRLSPIRLASFLEEKSDLLFAAARSRGIDCELDTSGWVAPVQADPQALMRVLMNLVENAVAAASPVGERRLRIAGRDQQQQAVVEVSDSGVGIPPEQLGQVFSPLFTTKSEGSGMGLAIVQKLMLKMGGLARIRSRMGEGTTVELIFPFAADGERVASSAEAG